MCIQSPLEFHSERFGVFTKQQQPKKSATTKRVHTVCIVWRLASSNSSQSSSINRKEINEEIQKKKQPFQRNKKKNKDKFQKKAKKIKNKLCVNKVFDSIEISIQFGRFHCTTQCEVNWGASGFRTSCSSQRQKVLAPQSSQSMFSHNFLCDFAHRTSESLHRRYLRQTRKIKCIIMSKIVLENSSSPNQCELSQLACLSLGIISSTKLYVVGAWQSVAVCDFLLWSCGAPRMRSRQQCARARAPRPIGENRLRVEEYTISGRTHDSKREWVWTL